MGGIVLPPDLIHTRRGVTKFRDVANRDRSRSVYILIDGKIVQGFGLPPVQKEVYDRGAPIEGFFSREQEFFTREQAIILADKINALADKINAAIRAASQRRKALQ